MTTRRDLLRGIGCAATPFLTGLAFASPGQARKQRLIVMFSPNGIVPSTFWPDEVGETFTLKTILEPLAPFRDRTLILRGVSNKMAGDGDGHMRGMGCLLTGIELFRGNLQGGSMTPAGWAKGPSIDQQLKNFLQSRPETRTRFGSLEFGVQVGDRADVWTRMVYGGPNSPIAPISDPYQMLNKLYGRAKDQRALTSILDDVRADLAAVGSRLGVEDRRLLEEHATFVREMERQMQVTPEGPTPDLPTGVKSRNEDLPRASRMQIDLMVNALANDFARVATLQYTRSVGQARMTWIGVDRAHHDLSHKSEKDAQAQADLTKINRWFCGELAYLVKSLAETREPGSDRSLLDGTTVVWANELGQGNHTRDNIPFVLVGGGLGFRTGRSLHYQRVPHNRLLLSLAHGFGHHIERFGNPEMCVDGPLADLT